MPRIWLRHPRVAAPPGLCYGRLELDLAETAAEEITAALSACLPCGAVWRSPALRCERLAGALASRDGVSVVVDERLRELDFGDWEGRRWDGIDRAESDPWAADPLAVAPPGGEPFAAMLQRVGALLEDPSLPDDAALVTHAGVIRAARMLLEGVAFDEAFATPVPYAAPLTIANGRARADGSGEDHRGGGSWAT
ncbi:MAG: histidine phosphatase family protein [Pseudomonadota bacterium]